MTHKDIKPQNCTEENLATDETRISTDMSYQPSAFRLAIHTCWLLKA